MCSSVLSCKQNCPPTVITPSHYSKIESALRDLLVTQRAEIGRFASFVYERDTLSGGITVLEEGEIVIGRWTVEIADGHAHARTQTNYGFGVVGERVENDDMEVELTADGDSIKVTDWKAYTEWREQLRH